MKDRGSHDLASECGGQGAVWGQTGTAVKDRGSHDLASKCGAHRACFKA